MSMAVQWIMVAGLNWTYALQWEALPIVTFVLIDPIELVNCFWTCQLLLNLSIAIELVHCYWTCPLLLNLSIAIELVGIDSIVVDTVKNQRPT